ncbi:hypothetical protein AU210_014249 [Fusarium oxysporum f. sp. radicis-cucumerinum]|uniref:2EXR domain-containing protein n=2 Tax=Fusarium oxysporum TaxID=5507 RepID=A0A2H3G5N8_FUSOX|nr:hypothetical protein AU210_014249 [Fusarium oxysporum f. sp. radicis-cucumerinum]RKK07906.1 hypothetical protein BFJ65_g17380 [Fusarium oxysporum f. sp. cepae]RKK28010.1 hypothetical protein BFJ67_g15822 [Fusarium oxysporum f. sp. cepae]RKK31340.1 hypothetical protein BFJ66_g15897 [Fusarium oxysporum f. sp. cepae]RKL11748.1 hypothetical protein BFJ71_g229 [Fusarium oxysporum]
MSRATFHPFPNLPVEIRLQIWEDACFDWSCGRSGLHYIKLDENRQLAPLNCEWQTTGPRNRSAYLWHAGLWTACKESRDIAAKHWSNQGWPDFQENTKDKSLGDVIWFDTSFPPPVILRTGLIHRKGDYEPWHQVADMHSDIFCVTAESWEPLVRNWKPLHVEAEDEWGRHFIEDVTNIAVDFDPSWNLLLKNFTPDNRIKDYPPALGFLIRLLLDQAYDKEHRKRVQLIDRNVLWNVDNERLACRPIYVDCNHEYFEVHSFDLQWDSPLSHFLSLLDSLIGDKLTKIEYGEQSFKYSLSESDWEQDDRLSPEVLVGFVVRRDNLRPRNLIR